MRGGNSRLARGGDACERQAVGFDVGTRGRKEANPRKRNNTHRGWTTATHPATPQASQRRGGEAEKIEETNEFVSFIKQTVYFISLITAIL